MCLPPDADSDARWMDYGTATRLCEVEVLPPKLGWFYRSARAITTLRLLLPLSTFLQNQDALRPLCAPHQGLTLYTSCWYAFPFFPLLVFSFYHEKSDFASFKHCRDATWRWLHRFPSGSSDFNGSGSRRSRDLLITLARLQILTVDSLRRTICSQSRRISPSVKT